MRVLAAQPDESLLDYLSRVLATVHTYNEPLRCEHGHHVFVAQPTMTSTEILRAWFAGARRSVVSRSEPLMADRAHDGTADRVTHVVR